VRERLQKKNCDPRSLVITRACSHVAHSPTACLGSEATDYTDNTDNRSEATEYTETPGSHG